ncbi:MAG: hypothetical protein ABSF09_13445 [Candidatus Bathyarchaeia archaeon]|jgi:ElaB/YqjD/DUF883 family membrane-anchored ribosome-binding protein
MNVEQTVKELQTKYIKQLESYVKENQKPIVISGSIIFAAGVVVGLLISNLKNNRN